MPPVLLRPGQRPGRAAHEDIGRLEVTVREAALVQLADQASDVVNGASEDCRPLERRQFRQPVDERVQTESVWQFLREQVALVGQAAPVAMPDPERAGRGQTAQPQTMSQEEGA